VRLRHELDRFEAAMQHEIEQETEDIAEMRRRMRTHLDTMRETYRSELHTIDVQYLKRKFTPYFVSARYYIFSVDMIL